MITHPWVTITGRIVEIYIVTKIFILFSKIRKDRFHGKSHIPAQMRAVIEEEFHTRVNMVAATIFLWVHESHASPKRRTQNFPARSRTR